MITYSSLTEYSVTNCIEDYGYRNEATIRGILEESSGSKFEVESDDLYYCEKYAHHVDIAEEDRIQDAPLDVDMDSLEYVEGKIKLKLEKDFADTFFKTGVWANDYNGAAATNWGGKTLEYWNRSTSKPIAQIKALCTNMQKATGKRPTDMLIGREVLDQLLEHPDFIGRYVYTQTGIIDLAKLSALFDLRIQIADGIINNAKAGQADSMDFIFDSKSVLLTHNSKKMSRRTVTAAAVFAWTGLKGANAIGGRTLRIPLPKLGEGAERIESECAYDMVVIAADLGVFLNDIIE